VDPRIGVIQFVKQYVRGGKRGVAAEIDFGERGKPA
jgi:hypothetical protein